MKNQLRVLAITQLPLLPITCTEVHSLPIVAMYHGYYKCSLCTTGTPELVGILATHQKDPEIKATILQALRNHFGNIDVCQKSSTLDTLEILNNK